LAQARTGPIAIEEATIADLEAAYISGRTTARAVTPAHLDRIEAYDKRGPFINSLITVNPRALEEADRFCSGRSSAPPATCRANYCHRRIVRLSRGPARTPAQH
jgi:hypothetical protein